MVIISFRTLLTLIVKFDLETFQIDVVNIFVYIDLDELIYIKNPLDFPVLRIVFKFNKALYSFKRLPLLWQTIFIRVLKDQGFQEVFQKPCVVSKEDIFCFFFVDDIVFAFRKKD